MYNENSNYPSGVLGDNDPHFTDNTEPDDEPEPDESLFAAEVFGEPWPRDAAEAAGYQYEIAHWPHA